MSAEGIYKRLIESNEDIGLATVYRVLTQFQAAGLVSVIILKTAWPYSSSTRERITTISCVWTAAASKSSSMSRSKNARKRLPRGWGTSWSITR